MKTDLLILADKTTSVTSPQNLVKILDYANTLASIFDTIHIMTALDYSRCSSIPIPDNIKLHIIDEWSQTSGIMRVYSHIRFFWKLIVKSIAFLKNEPQIRVVTNPYGHYLIGIPLVLVARLTGRKLLIRIACDTKSGIITAYERFGIVGKFFFETLFKTSERLVLSQADAIISVSPIFLEDCAQYADKTTIATEYYPIVDRQLQSEQSAYSIDISSNNSSNNKSTLMALFVGRLAPGKGISLLLTALSQMSNIHCRIVGDGELKLALQEQAENLGLEDRVKFTGRLPKEDVYKEMQMADFLILPSFSEYTPNVIVEAAAMGIPSVATDVGGIRYFVRNRETGLLCQPELNSLSVAIDEMKGSQERLEWGRNAYHLACEMFNAKMIDTKIEHVYKSLSL